MADNTPTSDGNFIPDSSLTDDNNAMFGDFFELDLLDSADSNSDLFSFLLNNEDFNAVTNSPSSLSTDSLLDLSTLDGLNNLENLPLLEGFPSQEDTPAKEPVKAEEQDLRFLIAHNLQQQQEQQIQVQAQVTSTAASIDNSSLVAQLTTPAELAAPPQNLATPAASPATPTMKAPEASILAAAATAQIAILLDSSKSTAVTAAAPTPSSPAPIKAPTTALSPTPAQAPSPKKRSSPEPSAASRKKAKVETPAAPALTPISAKPPPTLASLTSTTNTTLSAATLQFLLQQQMQTPLVPQLFTGKLTREEIEETLARLLESTKYLIEASKEAEEKDENMDSDGEDSESAESNEPGQTHGLKTQPGIKTDDIPSSKDLKKMTSKERRQLRNKISARNFRVRRKEYISTLEGQVEQHKTEARHLREAVTIVQAENQRLKEELEASKRQLAQATITRAASTASPQQLLLSPSASLSSESQSLLTSLLTRNAINPNASNAKNVTLTMPRPQSPIIKPNLNKDVPNSSSVSGKSWKDENPVFIHTTLIPEIRLADSLQFGPKPLGSKEDDMSDLPWLCMESPSKTPSALEKNPLLMSGVIYELMQTIASAGLDNAELTLNKQDSTTTATVAQEEESKAMAQDYESDRRMGEALEWKMQMDLMKEAQAVQALAARRLDVDQDIDNELSQEDLMRMFAHLNGATAASAVNTPTVEDPNMMEWLYESMMAGLVELDLQAIQDRQTFLPFSEVQYA
ncbi:hypothetical protein K457DRAFT_19177 [Linnemannia elongata AG-77]|uniref:BZIP domain-containing protein n=1 Tax=Linnemannia elongata AG-77 TaxID=1314771 RepID=A0A197JVX2_9FUNG|nr:hypothetical protein K457DRAFT_19177 [Linnemannia elongata AG-77]